MVQQLKQQSAEHAAAAPDALPVQLNPMRVQCHTPKSEARMVTLP